MWGDLWRSAIAWLNDAGMALVVLGTIGTWAVRNGRAVRRWMLDAARRRRLLDRRRDER